MYIPKKIRRKIHISGIHSLTKNTIIPIVLLVLMAIRVVNFNMPILLFYEDYSSLDASWIYAMNEFSSLGLISGENLFFTYGPLGKLIVPIGHNIIVSMIFILALLAYTVPILWKNVITSKSDRRIYRSIVVCLITIPLYSLNCFILFVCLLMSITALHHKRSYIHLGLLCFLAAFLSLIKFDLAVAALLQALALCFCLVIRKLLSLDLFSSKLGLSAYENDLKHTITVKQIIFHILIVACIPVVCVLLYLIYNPSFKDMIAYYKAMILLSKYYNSAMATPGLDRMYIVFVILLLLLHILILIVPLARKRIFLTGLLGTIPILYAYKSSIVRPDHEHFLISASIICATFVLLFFYYFKYRDHSITHSPIKEIYLGMIMIILSTSVTTFTLRYPFTPQVQVGYNLPQEIRETIGDRTTTAYPWIILWKESDDLNFVCFPSLQSYVAFYPELDQMNSDFFNGTDAPEFIIFECKTIDNRFLFWEAPLTTNAIFSNYECCQVSSSEYRELYLLRHTDSPTILSPISNSSFSANITDTITLPYTNDGSIRTISLSIRKTLPATIKSLFFRIEPLYVHITFSDGTEGVASVIPEQLTSDLPLDYTLPDGTKRHITSISFLCDDIDLYNETIEYTIIENTPM